MWLVREAEMPASRFRVSVSDGAGAGGDFPVEEEVFVCEVRFYDDVSVYRFVVCGAKVKFCFGICK